jgi:hypothetical protein
LSSRQIVGEDVRRLVDDAVGRPGGRRGERGLARQVLDLHVSVLHPGDNIRRY